MNNGGTRSRWTVRSAGFLMTFFLLGVQVLHALDISNVPLETAIVTPPPIVMFVLDNSASMNAEFMTDEPRGLFHNTCYLFPDTAYSPGPDHLYGSGHALSPAGRRAWKSQLADYNRLYYSPRWRYDPWPGTPRWTFNQADLQRPASNPLRSGRDGVHVSMASPFLVIGNGSTAVTLANAHYFTYHDANADGRMNADESVYLVTWADRDHDGVLDLSGNLSDDRRLYYRLEDDGDGLVEERELTPVVAETEKNTIRPAVYDMHGRIRRYTTDREELQNFANWFAYYRRREFTAKAIVAQSIYHLEDVNVGLYAVNGSPRIAARRITGGSAGPDNTVLHESTIELLDAVYGMQNKGHTALRSALDQVGRYLHASRYAGLGDSPFQSAANGGGCQKALSVLITDGIWNGTFTGAGNADGDNGAPFADAWADTLADVAMTYYENDLGPDLPDLVPSTECDPAGHQHMNTHVVSFGPHIDTDGYNASTGEDSTTACAYQGSGKTVHWPRPSGDPELEGGSSQKNRLQASENRSAELMADLRHAALNGHGRYFAVKSPQALVDDFSGVVSATTAAACAADVTSDGDGATTNAMLFQALYHTRDWSGDLRAYPLDGKGLPILDQRAWSASDELNSGDQAWDQRRIVTYGGRWARPQGIPFRYDEMSAAQLTTLTHGSTAEAYAKDLIDYLRGKPIETFRFRETLLGDIVHSGPVVFGRTVFAGGNDGMLHAFDSLSGVERFAYLPALTHDHLQALSEKSYTDHHQYYVDGPLYAGEVLVGEYQRCAYLVGGLGKGGKGYFCLLVGRRERTRSEGGYGDYNWSLHVDDIDSNASEGNIAELVRWEYPGPDPAADTMDNNGDGFADEPGESDPNIGYSFGQAYVVNANTETGSYRPVVVFGNGYDSTNQRALLYILSAADGEIIRVIDTGAGGENGLSTPALIDVDLDRRIDYAYAGDLNGNLWKFDLTSNDPDRWGVAYGQDNDGDGVIDAKDGDKPEPLFQVPGQSITGRPNVMTMHGGCAAQAPGYMVYFGTGRYLGLSDITDTTQQGLFAIWDYGDDSDDSESVGRLTSPQNGTLSSGLVLSQKQIVDQGTKDGVDYRQLSGDAFEYRMVEDNEDQDENGANNSTKTRFGNPQRYVGWFLNLPPHGLAGAGSAERITGDVIIRDGKIIVPSYVPDGTPCGKGGHSWLYILEACSGDSPSDAASELVGSLRFQGKVGKRPLVLKNPSQPRLDRIVFSDHSGHLTSLEMEGELWGRVYWRQN